MWKTINNGNGTYQDIGQGPAVVLLHGFSENSEVWKAQQEHLSKDYRVIVPDLPGTGKSPLTAGLTIAAMADYVYSILLAENIKETVVIGHSMGGYVALALQQQHPEVIKGLGLFHSTAAADTAEKKDTRRKSIEFIRQHGGKLFIRQTIPNLFSPATKTNKPELVDACIDMCSQCPDESLIAYTNAMMQRPDLTGLLSSVTAPMLFVIGKDDNAVAPAGVMQQVMLPNTSNIFIFEEVGHMGMWEKIEESNHLLNQFISFCQL
ncbi:alpha/beta fold hydrolase [Chitinophaga sp. sic0106]|uniref:alpha/beta fold hydrolase n=1 Tax=Chitinophaga sp. sic0106 TaxID=2854785 RepID=UPI001C47D897|nr:alpha/beta hydrolase [Chitinophaga sp. sic0106]MBV7533368.1 alpha/beta hydrolase [Chitinophaga sp. sic0106]